MATGTGTYEGLAVPLYGESNITGVTAANDILTITGAGSQSGDYLVCEGSTGTEVFVVSSAGAVTAASTLSVGGSVSLASPIAKMVLGTVALASLASNASATVALTGITTACVAGMFYRGNTTDPVPALWPAAANQLGYSATGGVTHAARTINVWWFATA